LAKSSSYPCNRSTLVWTFCEVLPFSPKPPRLEGALVVLLLLFDYDLWPTSISTGVVIVAVAVALALATQNDRLFR
jgi:hypothetical protein